MNLQTRGFTAWLASQWAGFVTVTQPHPGSPVLRRESA